MKFSPESPYPMAIVVQTPKSNPSTARVESTKRICQVKISLSIARGEPTKVTFSRKPSLNQKGGRWALFRPSLRLKDAGVKTQRLMFRCALRNGDLVIIHGTCGRERHLGSIKQGLKDSSSGVSMRPGYAAGTFCSREVLRS